MFLRSRLKNDLSKFNFSCFSSVPFLLFISCAQIARRPICHVSHAVTRGGSPRSITFDKIPVVSVYIYHLSYVTFHGLRRPHRGAHGYKLLNVYGASQLESRCSFVFLF